MNPRAIASIVEAAKAGDERAFAELVRAFQDMAVAYATSILGDHHAAEDAAQEAFLDAYRLLDSLREPAAFAGWFRRIVFKHCDRVTRRRENRPTELDAAVDVASSDLSPQDAVEASETRDAVNSAIAALSPPEQEIVLLYYMGDRSQAEIADFLGITPNTVKTRLYAARRRLRAHMSEIEKELGGSRPSAHPTFAEKVRRLIQPEALKQKKPWMWSPGIGTDVWAMFSACVTGDLATVKALLEKDPSLIRCHYEYRTPLSFAVRENQLEVAAYLLDHGAAAVMLGDPLEMARDRGYLEMLELLERKMLAKHDASSEGERIAAPIRDRHVAKVRQLLDERPELIHAGDERFNQPIHWAVMTRQLDMIDELLARGADIDTRRADGARPIHLTNGDYHYRGWRDVSPLVRTTPDDVYRHLVARGADVDLGMAAFKGDIGRVRQLLVHDPGLANRVSEYGSYYIGCGAPLKNAAAGGHVEIVKLLLAHGADPNLPEEGIAPRGHALYSAVSEGNYEIAKLLLEHGAFPNPPVESSADAVWIAIRRGDTRMLALLGSYGAVMDIPLRLDGKIRYADLVATGVTLPLKILAYYGDVKAVGARVTADSSLADDPAALSSAAGNGHAEIVELLLRLNPSLARRVTVSKPREMAELLFRHGMDPDRPDWLRKTPLHGFAQNGDIESAALFLDHGADLSARDEERCSTALAWAAMSGQTRMVEFLLRRGAKPTLPGDPTWATPLAWARRRGHEDIVRILSAYETAGPPPPKTLADAEALVRDLMRAYDGDEESLTRIIRHFRIERPMTWDKPPLDVQVERFRNAVRERLESTRGAVVPGDTMAVETARQIIAWSEGHATWDDLVTRSGSSSSGT